MKKLKFLILFSVMVFVSSSCTHDIVPPSLSNNVSPKTSEIDASLSQNPEFRKLLSEVFDGKREMSELSAWRKQYLISKGVEFRPRASSRMPRMVYLRDAQNRRCHEQFTINGGSWLFNDPNDVNPDHRWILSFEVLQTGETIFLAKSTYPSVAGCSRCFLLQQSHPVEFEIMPSDYIDNYNVVIYGATGEVLKTDLFHIESALHNWLTIDENSYYTLLADPACM